MNIIMRDPAKLIPHPNNPKLHPDEQVDAIAQSITNFGFDQPIVIDAQGVIIKGHGRRLAAMKLGMKSVPVIVSEGDKQAAKLNRILDNHLTSRDYDQYNLREDLTALNLQGALGMALFEEKDIPQQYSLVPKSEASLFSLVTKHKCPKCGYRW
jgi:ParB-like chromosome segregation protein Spo0J